MLNHLLALPEDLDLISGDDVLVHRDCHWSRTFAIRVCNLEDSTRKVEAITTKSVGTDPSQIESMRSVPTSSAAYSEASR